jgi:hypothetical protein
MMAKARPLPDAERVRQLFDYDPEAGQLLWKERPAPNTKLGAVAGSVSGSGYVYVNVDKQSYRAHRIIWLWVTGEDPGSDLVDHIDGDRLNNRFANLRRASYSQNGANYKKPRRNTSGYKGVSWSPTHGKWAANIRHQGRLRWLGRFDSTEEAHAAYLKAAAELFGEFARAA